MRKWVRILLSVFVAGSLASCNTASTPEETPTRGNEHPSGSEPVQDKQPGGLARKRDLIQLRPDFHQIGLAYNAICAEGKPPKSKEDFRSYLKSPKLMKHFDDGIIEFYYNVSPLQMPEGSSNTIVGYEPRSDQSAQRLVIMGDGSVKTMTDAEYAKAPKAKR